MRTRLLLTTFMVLFIGCAGNKAPDVQIAHTGNTILQSATALQKGITAATDSGTLPVAVAQKLTSYNQIILDKSGPLGEALRVYHSAATLDVRKAKAADIQTLITDINNAVGKTLSEGLTSELSKLVGNVMSAVSSVQLEVAKGLAGGA